MHNSGEYTWGLFDAAGDECIESERDADSRYSHLWSDLYENLRLHLQSAAAASRPGPAAAPTSSIASASPAAAITDAGAGSARGRTDSPSLSRPSCTGPTSSGNSAQRRCRRPTGGPDGGDLTFAAGEQRSR